MSDEKFPRIAEEDKCGTNCGCTSKEQIQKETNIIKTCPFPPTDFQEAEIQKALKTAEEYIDVLGEEIFGGMDFIRICDRYIDKEDAIPYMDESYKSIMIWGEITFKQRLRQTKDGWKKSPLIFDNISKANKIEE